MFTPSLSLSKDPGFNQEEDGCDPVAEAAHDGQSEGPGEVIVFLIGHPVSIVASDAKDDHGNGTEES